MENRLLALKIFGGLSRVKVPLEIPEDETKINELEMIFNLMHEGVEEIDYEKEAEELLKNYESAVKKQKIMELNLRLDELDEESEEYDEVLREIRNLQKNMQ